MGVTTSDGRMLNGLIVIGMVLLCIEVAERLSPDEVTVSTIGRATTALGSK